MDQRRNQQTYPVVYELITSVLEEALFDCRHLGTGNSDRSKDKSDGELHSDIELLDSKESIEGEKNEVGGRQQQQKLSLQAKTKCGILQSPWRGDC